MSCQSYHCAQGRQPCPTPYTCRHACTTLKTHNSDGSDPHSATGQRMHKPGPLDGISLFFLVLGCAGGLVAVVAMLAGFLSVRLA